MYYLICNGEFELASSASMSTLIKSSC